MPPSHLPDPLDLSAFPPELEPEARAALQVLHGEFGAEAAGDLVRAFLADTPGRLREMRALVGDAARVAELERSAHSLKGSCSIFALAQLQALAGQAEACAERKDPAPIPALIDALEARFAMCRIQLERWLKEAGGTAGPA
jgi:HPt (histidine-containing phosphotransfer) domain-containing protein